MKISIDTKEDSHDEIRKVINMLQNILGDAHQIFSNLPAALNDSSTAAESANSSPFANIFGDSPAPTPPAADKKTGEETSNSVLSTAQGDAKEEVSQSTEDLFAELFSEEELKKMDNVKNEEDEEEEQEIKSKSKYKKPDIEFY